MLIHDASRSIASLAPSLIALEDCAEERDAARRALDRGYFSPREDESLRAWFARYLTTRVSLLETIDDLAPIALGTDEACDDNVRRRAFLAAYTAACMLVRTARFLVDEIAVSGVVRRKLDEADPLHRVPRKQYTSVFRSLTSPLNAWRLLEATRFADVNRPALEALADDPDMGPVLEVLRQVEPAVRVAPRRYLRARLVYRWHAMRRRQASAVERSLFMLLEGSGRMIAEVRPKWHQPRADASAQQALGALLRPGDVIVTRHEHALSNLFLPGYWPHVALYVGFETDRAALEIAVEEQCARRWCGGHCILEARKDGVLFRVLNDTLAVDAVAVIRPMLDRAAIAEALARAIRQEGKLYNFDFDFSRSDRLVCTEVVYRAYDGIGPMQISLRERAGRYTLSAEDLLDLALAGRGFTPVAVFGAPTVGNRVVIGEEARRALVALKGSYV